ncbi:RNA polymerase II C-terminal domain phosphatase-like 4 [Papaver somniferum]|uniref:RNA polymerase II C-terminal domain phosphatase-like 4 n=1 Tax=Papaver somniferum TaxID=3469 RepID=UPI000E6F97FF|nr:RNA polymerase II C-terminal domain phosphatase-like 4 [Papaver somniferum]XP_026379204.1 RNA polymerase II C-terminal domain phosphatase-like 4 [Papaver somniferum]XP_026379252.1 RNA polymerase II C-terminal domain phosphatase-like 4 [Papaver somniferum]
MTTLVLSYEGRLKEAHKILKRMKIKQLMSYNAEENKRLIQRSRMLGTTYKRCFFENKKLSLVLDLDHTLIHSVRICDVSKDDQDYLDKKAIVVSSMQDDNCRNGDILYKYMGAIYVKLRPYTREFLKQLSDRFELFLYTMGTRFYAEVMGKLLDPDGVIFNSIVSKDDSTIKNRKNMDILAGPDEKNTIIIDDNKYVWEEHQNNLIQIDKYTYFTEENGGHKLKKDDQEGFGDEDEALKSISEVLQGVHKSFFELFPIPQTDVELQEYVDTVDVRPVLKASRK